MLNGPTIATQVQQLQTVVLAPADPANPDAPAVQVDQRIENSAEEIFITITGGTQAEAAQRRLNRQAKNKEIQARLDARDRADLAQDELINEIIADAVVLTDRVEALEDQVATIPAGAQGEQGIQGIPGKDGANGKDGLNGKDGKDGSPGIQGPQGIQGIAGPKGDTGAQGAKGDTVTGPAGPQGPIGPTGNQGAVGPTGVTGPQGPQGPAGVDLTNPRIRTKRVTTVAMLAGEVRTATILWDTPFADDKYTPVASIIGPQTLNLTVNIVSFNKDGVTVSAKNALLTSLAANAATITLIAIHD